MTKEINWDEVTLEPMESTSGENASGGELNEFPVLETAEITPEITAPQSNLETESVAEDTAATETLAQEIRSDMLTASTEEPTVESILEKSEYVEDAFDRSVREQVEMSNRAHERYERNRANMSMFEKGKERVSGFFADAKEKIFPTSQETDNIHHDENVSSKVVREDARQYIKDTIGYDCGPGNAFSEYSFNRALENEEDESTKKAVYAGALGSAATTIGTSAGLGATLMSGASAATVTSFFALGGGATAAVVLGAAGYRLYKAYQHRKTKEAFAVLKINK